MKTVTRTSVILEKKADADLIESVRKYGVRRMSRTMDLSPSFISRIIRCEFWTPIEHVTRMREIARSGQ